MTPSESEHATFQLVAQRLNQLKRKETVGVGGEMVETTSCVSYKHTDINRKILTEKYGSRRPHDKHRLIYWDNINTDTKEVARIFMNWTHVGRLLVFVV